MEAGGTHGPSVTRLQWSRCLLCVENVTPVRARVDEEERDGRHQDTDGHEDLQAQAQSVAHVRRRQLVDVAADGGRGRTGRDVGDEAARANSQKFDTPACTTPPTIMKTQLPMRVFVRPYLSLKWPQHSELTLFPKMPT
ncbi:hypothetical protein PI124_g2818 [Phytophthora idaei]|nr:hypothetical protein PI125_g2122 [Phytophthora idaei]KAG3169547.1 hypothetical protein PI126_g2783 [Phytophthora idaei]KAG3252596.1 hypothetical protein PI124_g2818 [Phytophthora idaei]